MSVLSTTRRRPGGDGCSASSCSASDSAPASGYTSTSIGQRARRADDSTRRISPTPGRNTSTSPSSSRSARDDRLGHRAPRSACPSPCGSERMSTGCCRPSLSTIGTGPSPSSPSTAASCRAVGRRRHRQDAQIGSQRGARIERQGQAEVGRQVALVHLVEDDDADAGQLGIVLQPSGQHALGHDLDARGRGRSAARRGSGSRRCRRRARRAATPSDALRRASPAAAARASRCVWSPSHG